MKRGEHVLVEIQDLTPKGDGIGWINDREVIVPRTVPGDQAVIFLKKKRRGQFQGEADAFHAYGLPRQTPPCEHFGICGGCRWQDISYTDQLALKEGLVRQALKAHGIAVEDEILPILPSPAPLFYRNKMEYSFGVERDGQLRLGLHIRGRYDRIFDVHACYLQSETSNRIVREVREKAAHLGIPAYDQKVHQGVLRFLVIREGKNSGEILVNLVVAEYPSEAIDMLATNVLANIPEIDTWVITLHQGKAQVATGEQEFIIKGSGIITEKCGAIDYEISPRSFFQTNPQQAENMLRIVANWAALEAGDTVLDLYCGTGSFSLYFAHAVKRVIGVEVIEDAVEDAKKNAARNNIGNCEFLAGVVEEVLDSLTDRYKEVDLVVVDPPRAGIHKKALKALARLKPPAIIYVSCNPQTLAENLVDLMAAGYGLKKLQAVDMFPQTPHCEVLTLLTAA